MRIKKFPIVSEI